MAGRPEAQAKSPGRNHKFSPVDGMVSVTVTHENGLIAFDPVERWTEESRDIGQIRIEVTDERRSRDDGASAG